MAGSFFPGDNLLRKPTTVPRTEKKSIVPYWVDDQSKLYPAGIKPLNLARKKFNMPPFGRAIGRSKSAPDLSDMDLFTGKRPEKRLASLNSFGSGFVDSGLPSDKPPNACVVGSKEKKNHEQPDADEEKADTEKVFKLHEDFSSILDGWSQPPTGEGSFRGARFSLEKRDVEEPFVLVLEPEKDLSTLSDGRRQIPPSVPQTPKGKFFFEKPHCKTPLGVEEACSIIMQWPPTVVKLAAKEKPSKLTTREFADKQQFCVCYLKPENQGYESKHVVGASEMEGWLRSHGLYERMVARWPSVLGQHGKFWRKVYLENGSNSRFPAVEYFNSGLDAASRLDRGHLGQLVAGVYTVEAIERVFRDIQASITVVKIDDEYFLLEIDIPLDPGLNVCSGRGCVVPVLPSDTLPSDTLPSDTLICLPDCAC